MKLLKAEISNYKSLKNVEIEFGNLTIFIGKNSHGKSNFVEALYLFFNEFDPAPQSAIANVPQQLWTEKENRKIGRGKRGTKKESEKTRITNKQN